MDLTRIIFPKWVATKPTRTSAPVTIDTEERLRNATSGNDVSVVLAGDIQLTGQPLAITGANIYIGTPGGTRRRIIAPAGAKNVVVTRGAHTVELDNIIFDGAAPKNPEMIAVNVDVSQHLTFTDCLFRNYGRIGARFVGGNSHMTFDGCKLDGGETNIYHGIGISNDGKNEYFVIYDCFIHGNGHAGSAPEYGVDGHAGSAPEYGVDGHVTNLILADNDISGNGRCIKLPGANNAWVYGNLLADGPKNDLGAIWLYNSGDGPARNVYIFDNSIRSDVAHLRYQHGAQVCFSGNRTYTRVGVPVEEKIAKGNGGGTLTRSDPRITAFLDGQPLPPVEPPEPPPPPSPDLDALTARVAALEARLDELPAGIAEQVIRMIGHTLVGVSGGN